MNKMMKGSIAGATGVALLMGGFGTYALWSDSEQARCRTACSPVSSPSTPSPGAYDDTNTAAANDWSASDKMVPGDNITYTQTFTVTGTGNNLEGTIDLATRRTWSNDFSTLTRDVDVVQWRTPPPSPRSTRRTSSFVDAVRHRHADRHRDLRAARQHRRPRRPGSLGHHAGVRLHHQPVLSSDPVLN